jgi:hypothetical protein
MFSKQEHKVAMLMRLIVGPLGPKWWCFQLSSNTWLPTIYILLQGIHHISWEIFGHVDDDKPKLWMKEHIKQLDLQMSSMFKFTWRVSKQSKRWLILTLMLTSILPNLQEIPRCFMKQHGNFLQKGVNMTCPSGKEWSVKCGWHAHFQDSRGYLTTRWIAFALIMSSRLTTSSSSQSPHHLGSL